MPPWLASNSDAPKLANKWYSCYVPLANDLQIVETGHASKTPPSCNSQNDRLLLLNYKLHLCKLDTFDWILVLD
jgi:hypothetical protein